MLKNKVIKEMKRKCVLCGAKIDVIVHSDRSYSGGNYFGKILPGEYWECDKCYKLAARSARQ